MEATMRPRFPAAFLALLLIFLCSSAAWPQKASLPFIEDDYAQALAQARQREVPLFVEVWAPW
jgi:hypothetical protein